jgi:hypothetical protein
VRRWRLLQIDGRVVRAEREMGMGSAQTCHVAEGEREKEGGGCGVGSWTMGLEWLQVAQSEAVACARGGGRLANNGGRRGAGDAAWLTGGSGGNGA